jgi:hypothetical protein
MFFFFLLCVAYACDTSTQSFTRDSTNVTSVVISSDADLTVTLVESDSFELQVSFFGPDSAQSVCSQSYDDISIWTLNIASSAPTDPPSSSSSLNSQVFFSSSSRAFSMLSVPAYVAYQAVNGQCTEAATVTLSANAGWRITEETRSLVTISYFGPKAYGYDLSVTFPGETVSSWSSADEDQLLADLTAFYNDPLLSFSVTSHTDVNGLLVVVLNVLGFPSSSSAETSHDLISSGGFHLESPQFSSATADATHPGLTCGLGYSTTDSSDVCTIRDCGVPTAPTGYAVGSGSTTYGSSYSMTCATGYSGTATALTCQSSGSWTSASGCTIVSCSSSPTQTGYTIASGSSTYDSQRTVTCGSGMSGTASTVTCSSSGSWTTSTGCSDINGCASNACTSAGNSGATCSDVPAPGTGYSCTCTSGYAFNGNSCVASDGRVLVKYGYTSSATRSTVTQNINFYEPSTDYRVTITPAATDSLIKLRFMIPFNPGHTYCNHCCQSMRAFRMVAGVKSYSLTSTASAHGSRPQSGREWRTMVCPCKNILSVPSPSHAIFFIFRDMMATTRLLYFGKCSISQRQQARFLFFSFL